MALKHSQAADAASSMYRSMPFILSHEDGEFEVGEEAALFLSGIRGPIAVITLVGDYRTGKSTFMNHGILQVPHSQGFQAQGTTTACTKGIWVHTKTIPCHGGEGTLIVLDTEGLGAQSASETHDTRVFALALLLCSYFVYNSKDAITRTSLSLLSLVAKVSKQIRVSTDSASADGEMSAEAMEAHNRQLSDYFPTFHWILRDFALRMEDPVTHRPVSADTYLEQNLQDTGREEDRTRQVIRSVFPKRRCTAFCRPTPEGVDVTKTHEMTAKQLVPEFMQQIDAFRDDMLATVPYKKIMGREMDGAALVSLARAYVSTIANGAAPVIKATWQLMAQVHARDSVTRIAESTLKLMQDNANSGTYAVEEMSNMLKKLQANALDEYRKACYSDVLDREDIESGLTELSRIIGRQHDSLIEYAKTRIEKEISEVISAVLYPQVQDLTSFVEIQEKVNSVYLFVEQEQVGGATSSHLKATWLSKIQPHLCSWASSLSKKQEQRAANLQEDIARLNETCRVLRESESEHTKRIESVRQEYMAQCALLEKQIEQLRSELQEALSRCTSLESDVLRVNEDMDVKSQGYTEKLMSMTLQVEDMRLRAEDAESKISALNAELCDALSNASTMLITPEQLAELQMSLDEYKTRVQQAKAELSDMTQKNVRLQTAHEKEMEAVSKELQDLIEEHRSARTQYASLISDFEQRNVETSARLQEANSNLAMTRAQLQKVSSEATQESERVHGQIATLRTELDTAKKQLVDERARASEELKQLRGNYESQLKALQEQNTNSQRAYQAARSQMIEEINALKMVEQQQASEIGRLKRKREEDELELRETKRLKPLLEEAKSAAAALQAQNELRKQHEQDLQRRLDEREAQMRSLQDTLQESARKYASDLKRVQIEYERKLSAAEIRGIQAMRQDMNSS